MSHSPSRIWIHAFWSTKDRLPLILPTDDQLIYKFLEGEFQEMGYPVNITNGIADHIPVLYLLIPQKSLAEVIRQAIGRSSHPIYQQNLIREKFSWQTGSAPSIVGGPLIKKESLHSEIQKERKVKKSFQSKYTEILKNHGFEIEI